LQGHKKSSAKRARKKNGKFSVRGGDEVPGARGEVTSRLRSLQGSKKGSHAVRLEKRADAGLGSNAEPRQMVGLEGISQRRRLCEDTLFSSYRLHVQGSRKSSLRSVQVVISGGEKKRDIDSLALPAMKRKLIEENASASIYAQTDLGGSITSVPKREKLS